MKKRLLYLLPMVFGLIVLTMADASAEIVKKPKTSKSKAVADKVAPAKPGKLTSAQQAEQARQAAEAQAKAEEEAKTLAEAEARARTEAEAKLRAEAEAKAHAETEAKTKRDAEAAAREKLLSDADALMAAGKPADAYALLEPFEFERSGEVRFDYLLGIAALDSGKPDKATLAFERVLAVDPNFAGARLDMARAYFQLGDLPRAKTEFQQVMAQNPPDAAKATIQKYLDAIAAQEAAKQTQLTGYVEGTVGHDGNLSGGVNQAQISTPATGPMTLGIYNVKMADNYFGVAAGAEVSHNVNDRFALYAGADLRGHSNFSQTVFNTISFEGRAGVSFAMSSANLLRLGISAGQFNLGSVHNRDSSGYDFEWRHVFSPSNTLSVFGQYARQRYVALPPLLNPLNSDPRINNTDLVIGGAGWQHVLADGKSALFASYYHGIENDVGPANLSPSFPAGGRADGAKCMNGVRVGGQISPNERWDVFASVGYQSGNYGRVNAAYGYLRSDQLQDMALGANWHWGKLWTAKPQLTYSRNNSNMSTYPYDRTDVSVTVHRDFR